MVTVRDEANDPPEVRDPLGAAVSRVIGCIFESLPTDCPARRAALCTVIECHTRVAALLRQQWLN
jgi:hypothetical protein